MKNWVKELKKMLGDDICLCIAGTLLSSLLNYAYVGLVLGLSSEHISLFLLEFGHFKVILLSLVFHGGRPVHSSVVLVAFMQCF